AMPPEILEATTRRWLALIEMAGALKLPLAISEQYPKGLGPTLPALKEAAARGGARHLEKVDFSCCQAPGSEPFLDGKSWIVGGMETHICVYQTVRDLVARGVAVQVPLDACVSRRKLDWKTGGALMQKAGAQITTTETVLFDLVGRAGSD